MCRMIAAAGRANVTALRLALLQMAANNNPAHRHERRSLGEAFRHEDGWGAAWAAVGELRFTRSPRSCLTDPKIQGLDDLSTDLLFLHARRASKPGSVRAANTHPFIEERNGRIYAFCHNGTVEDLRPLRPTDGWTPEGGTDSELLFHYLLERLDENDPAGSVGGSLDAFEEYTALNSFLACESWILAVAKRHPSKSQKEYHALWEGWGDGIHAVSCEPVNGIGCDRWKRMEEGGVVLLTNETTP
jgi:predicted glutamine amidotransferase